jgi:ATP-binding cassette subfamily B protein
MHSLSRRLTFTWTYLRPHRRLFVAGILALLARDAIAITIPLMIRKAVTLLSESHNVRQASWFAAAIVLAAIPKAGLQAFARLRLMYASRDAEYEIRNRLFRHLMSLEPAFFARMRTGDLMAHATNDLNAIKLMLGPGVANLFESMVTFPIAVAVMAAVDWRLTLAAFLPLPIAVAQMVWFGQRVQRSSEVIQARFSDLSALVEQHIAGVRSVRSYAQEDAERLRFETLNTSYFDAKRKMGLYSTVSDPTLMFLMGLATLTVLAYGGQRVSTGQLSLGSLVMFMTYLGTLLRPVSALGRVINMMQRGIASLGRLEVLFAVQPAIAAPLSPVHFDEAPRGDLLFENVSVRFGNVEALHHVDLAIPAGSRVAIVGHTGSGKSTLARLIPRLLDPSAGEVYIDGVNLRHLPPQEVRAHIGFVPQETFLFSATLAENIAWGAPNASETEIRKAASVAGLETDIAGFPEGFDTIVGERGVLLSGGQKQRVAIARAIIRKPSILIFDDALSSVDSVTEQKILDHLESALGGSTTILITHRLSSIRNADRIVVMDMGRIVESGTHQDLLATGGAYWRLWNQHALEEALETT